MEEKINNNISRRLLRDTPVRTHQILNTLQRFDHEHRFDPYLFSEILEYQAYNPMVHTVDYAIKMDSVELLKFLIDNQLDEEHDIINIFRKALQLRSENIINYIINTYDIPPAMLNQAYMEVDAFDYSNLRVNDDINPPGGIYDPYVYYDAPLENNTEFLTTETDEPLLFYNEEDDRYMGDFE